MSLTINQKVSVQSLPFAEFLENLKSKLKNVFSENDVINKVSDKRGIQALMINEIMSCNPLSVSVPTEFGGRGGKVYEILELMTASSYESLALSLTLGINSGLFLQPVAKYAQESAKENIFKHFLNDKVMGGLMITEPEHGSDALSMQTSFTKHNEYYHILGKKHWGGLTGFAKYWLLTARHLNPDGSLKRDIDFFICDVSQSEQKIEVEEYFDNLGLYMIPYGRNRIDVRIPQQQRLQPQSTGVHMMLDILHRSRILFPGMGLGFVKRMLDEAILHCQNRQVGNKSMITYDHVQHTLARLQANYTICSALCIASSELADIKTDLAPHGIIADRKSVV
jgi:alkylation response protein AidB-like acyl-CoA dehydrogenase